VNEPKIKRKFRSFSLTLTTSTVSASSIRFDDVAGGVICMPPGGIAATSLAVWVSNDPTTSGSFCRLYKDGSVVSMPVTPSATEGRAYPFPDEAYGVGAVRLVADHAGVTALTCTCMLKG
jgi:hypothetical protein